MGQSGAAGPRSRLSERAGSTTGPVSYCLRRSVKRAESAARPEGADAEGELAAAAGSHDIAE
jgi:hypothetical protein